MARNQADEHRPVHEFLQCSIEDALNMLCMFSVRHNLSWIAMEDLASLINMILGTDSIPTSKYLFKKRFEKKRYNVRFIYYVHIASTIWV